MDGLHKEYAFYGLLTVESFNMLVHVEKTDLRDTSALVTRRECNIVGEGFSISNLCKGSRERCLRLSHHLE